jgi:Ca2+-dependent lipid-binding protein
LKIKNKMVIGIIAIVCSMMTLVVFFDAYFKTRHKERMAMIERGMDINDKNSSGSSIGPKIAILFLCIGFGLLLGNLFGWVFGSTEVFTLSFILIFSGIGLVFHYRQISYKDDQE